jgi:hypothetical protein
MANPTQKRGFASDRGARQLTAAERAAMEGAAPEAAVTRDVAVGADGTPRVVPDPPRRQAGGGGGEGGGQSQGQAGGVMSTGRDAQDFLNQVVGVIGSDVAGQRVQNANLLRSAAIAGPVPHLMVNDKPVVAFYGFGRDGHKKYQGVNYADPANAAMLDEAWKIASENAIPAHLLPEGMTASNALESIADRQFGGDRGATLQAIMNANALTQTRYAQTADMTAHTVNAIHASPELQQLTGLVPAAGGGAPPVPPAGGGGGGGAGYWNEPSATFADLPVINDALADWKRRDLAIAGGLAAAGLGAGGLFLANYLGDRPAEIDPALAMAMAQSNQRGM